MKLADGLRRHGYHKWYERELLQSHVHLALTLLCLIGLMAAFEAASLYRSMSDQLIDGVAVLVCAGIGLWALRRYLYLLSHAEYVAHQADCPACGSYGRFKLVGERCDDAVQVCCRRCGAEWDIGA